MSRANHLGVLTSLDGIDWKLLYVNPPENVIVEPLAVSFPESRPARLIRL